MKYRIGDIVIAKNNSSARQQIKDLLGSNTSFKILGAVESCSGLGCDICMESDIYYIQYIDIHGTIIDTHHYSSDIDLYTKLKARKNK